MGQSVSRVNDRSSVPGPLGHGMGERPMIGVGREGGHEECATPETAGVPNPAPIRRKQTLGDQHHPPVKEGPKDDEQKGFRGRLRRGWLTTIGVFHRKHDNTNKKNDDNTSSNTSTSGIASNKTVTSTPPSQPLSPTAPSSSVIPPTSPPSSSGRSRAMSSPSLSSSLPKGRQSPVLSPTMRPRSDSMTSQPSSLVMHDKDKDKDHDDGIHSPKQLHVSQQGQQHQQEKPMTGNEIAAARAAAMKSGKPNDEQQQQHQQQHHGDVATSPRGGIHQVGSTSGGGGMALWWRNHHPNLEKMMPPKYAPGNSQPDELHRESRDPTYQASNPMEVHEPNSPSISKGGMVGSFDEAIPPTTMKPHVSRNIGGGVYMNPRKRSASPNRDAQMNDNDSTSASASGGKQQYGYIREHGSLEHSGGNRGMKQYGDTSVLPPMMSPWNTQPDELHREPRWRSNKTTGIGTGSGTSTGIGSGDDGGSDNNHGGYGSGGNDNRRMSHSHWWQPGGTSLHNNDQHTQPGGWPMNP